MVTLKKQLKDGTITIPASKSQTIRAFLIATFSKEKSIIRNPLISSDTNSCIEACRLLGAKIEFSKDKDIAYVDARGVNAEGKDLFINTQNSGTTTYLIYGLLGTLNARSVILSGDKQLNARPILPLVNAYRELGMKAHLEGTTPPVKIIGALKGGRTSIECRTSQYLSSLLLALPLAAENSVVDCPLLYEKPYVEITLSWLKKQNIKYQISKDLQHVEIQGGQKYHGFDEMVTGDFSSASFFFAAAAVSGKEITIKGLDRNDPQGDKHFLDILQKMGCLVKWDGLSVTVKGPKELKGGVFDLNSMPDALPVFSVVAAAAREPVSIVNVSQARIKETDRIACMYKNLKALGCDLTERPDGLEIRGKGYLDGGEVSGFEDHRIIMALAISSLITKGEVKIDDESAVDVTFPTFFKLLESLEG